ncbi:hypothetical protein [Brevibacterium sp. W7.2]|uniref:hypothetical protein n=1 Tax=Brevibacterium sp. W7.2 TaxID=2823518 RepID=UPI001BAC46E4|nr:hypothetical protein [Brevibacterium sp. W7.2]
MAEEQFTSRRARREAERMAAEEEFEARSSAPQGSEGSRADFLTPPKRPTEKPTTTAEADTASGGDAPAAAGGGAAPGAGEATPSARPSSAPASAPSAPPASPPQTPPSAQAPAAPQAASAPASPARPAPESPTQPAAAEPAPAGGGSAGSTPADLPSSRIDPAPTPKVSHERGALASDHLPQERPPVNAEDRLDPRRAPLPHFESRAARKRYLREHGLSMDGDLSTGAIPVIADPAEADADSQSRDAASPAGGTGPGGSSAGHESFDAAGFGGSSAEVAARDFESPVTADSAPRPASGPDDALSRPLPETTSASAPTTPSGDAAAKAPTADTGASAAKTDAATTDAKTDSAKADAATKTTPAAESDAAGKPAAGTDSDGPEPATRSRRMPIVNPPSTSGVRVVTAASAKVSEPGAKESPAPKDRAASKGDTPSKGGAGSKGEAGSKDGAASTSGGTAPAAAVSDTASGTAQDRDSGTETTAQSADDAARELAANPETRPMDTVPEAWSLPNADYEDEETENPPGTRIKASAVTGYDGQILVGEEPSKVPFIVLGVAALFAVALIVIALVMLL